MSTQYSHTSRTVTLSAANYNADHENHITNATPAGIDDFSSDVAQMQLQTDPGENGTENLATILAGELTRLRFVIAEMKGTTYWYETNAALPFASGTVLVFAQNAAPSGWTFLSSLADRIYRLATIVSNGGATGGSWVISGVSINHAHTYADTKTSLTGATLLIGGGAGFPFSRNIHTHVASISGNTATTGVTVSSTGAWRPAYVDSLPCIKT